MGREGLWPTIHPEPPRSSVIGGCEHIARIANSSTNEDVIDSFSPPLNYRPRIACNIFIYRRLYLLATLTGFEPVCVVPVALALCQIGIKAQAKHKQYFSSLARLI
jgi:hypothetical protein